MKKIQSNRADAILVRYAQTFAGLKQDLGNVTYFCKGTVLKRRMKCGQKRCACHRDPAKRHGPYFEWTYKEKGKTINRRLRPEEAPIFQAAAQQHRKLLSVLKRMERLSRKAVVQLALNSLEKNSS